MSDDTNESLKWQTRRWMLLTTLCNTIAHEEMSPFLLPMRYIKAKSVPIEYNINTLYNENPIHKLMQGKCIADSILATKLGKKQLMVELMAPYIAHFIRAS